MASIDPNYVVTIASRFNRVFAAVEAQRGVTIPASVRELVHSLFLESVLMRSDEWLTLQRIDCDDASQLPRTESIASDVLRSILDNAAADQIGQHKYITLIEVVRELHVHWCGIFPFCRK